jgi:hypothetical protein
MTAVTPTTATVSATTWLIGNQLCSTGTSASAIVVPPKAADKNPAKVTPICTADKNRFGFSCNRATSCPRLPRRARRLTWLGRSDTNAISAAANTPPMRMNTKIKMMLNTVSFTGDEAPIRTATEEE